MLIYTLLYISVLDDGDKTITAGSIVTVTVSLKRENLSAKFNQDFVENTENTEEVLPDEEEEEKEKEKVEEVRSKRMHTFHYKFQTESFWFY